MKYSCSSLFSAIATMLFIATLNSAPLDTKMIQWTQPNGALFSGRVWGDEYTNWMETQSGYRYVQGSGGWYYYATLDSRGEFAPTAYRVGIDTPPASSYKLE